MELPESEARDEVFGGCRGVEESYQRLDQIGEGTYGQVSSQKPCPSVKRRVVADTGLSTLALLPDASSNVPGQHPQSASAAQ